jgi:hypothetical protein
MSAFKLPVIQQRFTPVSWLQEVVPRSCCCLLVHRYMTASCRINNEPHTVFPFPCALQDLMRTRKSTTEGIKLPPDMLAKSVATLGPNATSSSDHTIVRIRERSFLENPMVPREIKVLDPVSWLWDLLHIVPFGHCIDIRH